MREREEVFDHFITAVINTLNADEIYDAAIEALQDILQPDGLLLMMNLGDGISLQILSGFPESDLAQRYWKTHPRPYDSKTAQLAECRTHLRHLYAQIQSGHYRLSLSCSP